MRALEAEEDGRQIEVEPAEVAAPAHRPPMQPIQTLDHDRREADPLPSDDDRRAELTADIWEMADRGGIDAESVHAWCVDRHEADIETADLTALADVRRAMEAGEIVPAAVAKVQGMFASEETK
jgi:hypothetical protein